MSRITLNISELVRFYDDEPDARTHSNAVKTVAGEELGLALFENYLKNQGRQPARVYAPCTTQGAWLDGWIKVAQPTAILFQIEVKSWSMHGYGSRKHQLEVSANAERLADYKMETWKHYWHAGAFKAKGLQKVLTPMTLPKGESGPVEPVACIWAAVHPEGANSEFFQVKAKGAEFATVRVFSMSAYLRNLLSTGTPTLTVDLPSTAKRMAYLSTLFPAAA